ncbi:bystin [Physcomitrium patens]|uniref:Bystin n=1 Tax=Physcomitrium patens TaxID=3218 RepID=A0A2K1JGA4_PHYPA|nr:bystin-like [Physcomitrium patens]PNR40582.1 hypothetical protein PHYPA_017985 [Physcomitrium patens]|eukprot:XP_024393638.1 bystin-like [Physcomitrella patens]
MASHSQPRAPGQDKKKRKDAGAEKHVLSLADQMEQSHEALPPKRRHPRNRNRQQATDEYVTPVMSNKILSEARMQQLEIDNERDEETGVAATRRAFTAAIPDQRMDSDSDDDDGFSDGEEQTEEFEEVTEEDERIMSMFMASDTAPQLTLADIIMERINNKGGDETVAAEVEGEGRTIPGVDCKIIEVYQGVGKLLSRYRAGKLPKAFKIIPSLSNWEDVLFLTEPERWSPNAMYQVTRVFASNLNARMAQRFYNLVLLPRIRNDIREHKRLHFALYQAMKKAVYKPSAFYKGLLLPLCQSRTCNLREAVIVGSVLQKVSIPVLHSSVALLKIAEMEYCGTNSYFLKLLLDKKYALPYRVLDAVLSHFVRFIEDDRDLPVIWHQSLLTFVQRYKNELSEEDKERLKQLTRRQKHYQVTPEIHRELLNSRNRGQKDHNVSIFPMKVEKAVLKEDMWNLPEVQISMDED